MFDFDYYNPTIIHFGKNKIESLATAVPADTKVLITYGGGSAVKSGIVAKAKELLRDREVYEFGGIEPNPQYDTLMKAVEIVREKGITFLLAIGGGSVIDGTKFIGLAGNYEGDCSELLFHGIAPIMSDIVPNHVPLGTVLTLPATGSEMNMGAVISKGHDKLPVMSPLSYPVFSILDPTYTFTLPERQVANGIVDAFVHTAEQYITFPVDARVQDRMAEGILQTLIEIGTDSIAQPENYEIRANHMWSATMALNGLIAVGVPQDWATHMIGHELTAAFGIDHGRTLAVIYPTVLEVLKEQKMAKLVQYAERVWGIADGSDEEKADQAIAKTREFFESLGVKTKLSEYGVTEDQLEGVVDQLKAHGMAALSENGSVTPDVSREILKKSL